MHARAVCSGGVINCYQCAHALSHDLYSGLSGSTYAQKGHLKRMLCATAGVAQHGQGELDAALQAFERAEEQAMLALQAPRQSHTGAAEPSLQTYLQPQPAQSQAAEEDVAIERVRRTAVKALMSQASIHKRLGRPKEALHAARQAASLDITVQRHVTDLEAAMQAG